MNFFLGRNFLYIHPIIKSVLYWIRFGSTYFTKYIFTDIEFLWIANTGLRFFVHSLFHVLKWLFAAVTFYYSFRWNWNLLRRVYKNKSLSRKRDLPTLSPLERFNIYYVCLFFAMAITTGLSPISIISWHLILCFPAVALFISRQIYIVAELLSRKKRKRITRMLILWFILVNFFAEMGSFSHSYKNNYHKAVMIYLEEKKK